MERTPRVLVMADNDLMVKYGTTSMPQFAIGDYKSGDPEWEVEEVVFHSVIAKNVYEDKNSRAWFRVVVDGVVKFIVNKDGIRCRSSISSGDCASETHLENISLLFIKWAGYDITYNTWELKEEIIK